MSQRSIARHGAVTSTMSTPLDAVFDDMAVKQKQLFRFEMQIKRVQATTKSMRADAAESERQMILLKAESNKLTTKKSHLVKEIQLSQEALERETCVLNSSNKRVLESKQHAMKEQQKLQQTLQLVSQSLEDAQDKIKKFNELWDEMAASEIPLITNEGESRDKLIVDSDQNEKEKETHDLENQLHLLRSTTCELREQLKGEESKIKLCEDQRSETKQKTEILQQNDDDSNSDEAAIIEDIITLLDYASQLSTAADMIVSSQLCWECLNQQQQDDGESSFDLSKQEEVEQEIKL